YHVSGSVTQHLHFNVTGFEQEMAAWKAVGQLNYQQDVDVNNATDEIELAEGEFIVESSAAGNVWLVQVEAGAAVTESESLIVLESMKMEIDISSPEAATISRVLVNVGQQVQAGQALLVLKAAK
uniref:acetyl-CoA carboxylase biotin carboxyl carrier protein subunit n=1 Tax=Shewanella sp. TaxID=50422 RepID=UPI0040487DD1